MGDGKGREKGNERQKIEGRSLGGSLMLFCLFFAAHFLQAFSGTFHCACPLRSPFFMLGLVFLLLFLLLLEIVAIGVCVCSDSDCHHFFLFHFPKSTLVCPLPRPAHHSPKISSFPLLLPRPAFFPPKNSSLPRPQNDDQVRYIRESYYVYAPLVCI